MHVIHRKVIDCSAITAAACSDLHLAALLHGPAFKLKADTPDDTVHGSVTIAHNAPPEPHEIIVEIYEKDEAPTVRLVNGRLAGRESTLKRPTPMPTARTIRARLDLVAVAEMTP